MSPRRTGWSGLSDSYKARLTRAGVSRKEWEAGADLRGARGHQAAPGPGHAPTEITARAVEGEATYQEIRGLSSWRHSDAPRWLPSESWMGNDVAAALSQLQHDPTDWEHVRFTPSSDGPWTMTVEYRQGYPQTIEIPGGSGAQEVMKMLSNPDAVGTDPDFWDDWVDDDRDFEVEESA